MIWLGLVIEQSWIWWTLFALMFITLTIVSIGVANRATGPSMMLDNSLDQSVEFLRDGIRYYKFKGMMDNLKYFFAVLVGKDEKIMHYYRYEDIEKVNVYANRKYMNVMGASPIAYEVYVPDFEFFFKDGTRFYFFWPMILKSEAKRS